MCIYYKKISLLFGLVCCIQAVFAQDNPAEKDRDVHQLDEVQVTAWQPGRKLEETAGGIAVLGQEDLQRQSEVDIMPALNTIPGVKMEAYNYGDYRLSVRGSLLRSPWSVRNVKMYWNDIPMTTAGGSNPITLMDVGSIGSLEVIKGPAGSMYGAGTGGVLLFKSSRPAYRKKSLETGFTVGSFGMYRAVASGRASTGQTQLTVNYINQHNDGYREHQGFDQESVHILGSLYPAGNQTVSFFALHSKTDVSLPGALTAGQVSENPRQAGGEFNSRHNTSLNKRNTNAGLSYRHEGKGGFSNVTSVFLNHEYTDHPFGSGPDYNGYLKQNNFGYGGRTRFTYRTRLARIRSIFSAGAEAQRTFISPTYHANLPGGVPGGVYNENEVNAAYYLLFLQGEFELTSRWLLTLGASYNRLGYDVQDLYLADSINSTGKRSFDPVLSPRLAAVYKLNDHIGAHASVSFGFAPPDNSEIFDPDGVVNSVKPEKGINYEAGIRGSAWKGRLHFDVSAYHMQIRDAIVSKRDESFQTIYSNAGATSHQGIEAAFSGNLETGRTWLSAVKPRANFTWNHFKFREYLSGGTEDVGGNQIPGISPVMISAGIDIEAGGRQPSRPGAYLRITWNYYDQMYLNDSNTDQAPAYSLLDIKAGYELPVRGHWKIHAFAGVNNAGNVVYTSLHNLNAAGDDPAYFNVSPGRNYYGGAGIKYLF